LIKAFQKNVLLESQSSSALSSASGEMGSLWETERLAEQGGEDDSVRKIKQNPDRQIKRVIIFSHFLRNSHGHGVKLLPKIFLIHFFSQRRNPPRIQTITRRLFWT